MMSLNTIWIISLFSVLLSNVVASETCGSKVCKDGQICEANVDGGTCYNSSAKIDCSDGISYCYKPRQCCGVSTCCPQNADCCGFNTCCPKGSVCCNPNYCCERGTTCCGYQTCCAAGSYCDGGICKADRGGPFKWWYIFFFLAPLLAVIGVIVRRRRRATLLRAAGAQGGVIVAVPVQTRVDQYGYDQGPISYGLPPIDSANTGRPLEPNCPPPAYHDVAEPKA